MENSIFREEVLQAHVDRLHGSIMLIRPLSSWLLVICAALIVTCILAYLVLSSYTKRVTATGFLLPVTGMVRVIPPVTGIVSERRVEEGQHVSKGDILFVLTDERSQINGSQTKTLSETHAASLEQRRMSLLTARDATQLLDKKIKRGIQNRLAMLQDELTRNYQQIDLQQERVDAAVQILERHRKLAENGFISALALQEKGETTAAQRAELLNLQRQNTELKRNLAASEDELNQLPIRTKQALADIDRDLGILMQDAAELQTRDRYAITAPMDGVVTSITAQLGQATNGQSLANLLPMDAQLEANLYLTSRAVGFIRIGQKVRLRYQAYPYQQFGQYDGVVKEVTRSPIQVSELPMILPFVSQEGVYRVTVKLAVQYILAYGEWVALRPGMTLEADIEQDRRRLIEWILEPIYGFQKYLS